MAGAIGSVVGALIGSDATKSAASKSARAVRDTNALQDKWATRAWDAAAPSRDLQQASINQIMLRLGLTPPEGSGVAVDQGSGLFGSLLQPFNADGLQDEPGYRFTRDEGMRGLQNTAAARGGLYSGATLRDATRFNQGLAETTYGNAFNRNMNQRNAVFNMLTGANSNASGTVNNAFNMGQNAATNMGNNLMMGANDRANAGLARASLWSNALNQGISQGQQNNWWGMFGNQQSTPNDWLKLPEA